MKKETSVEEDMERIRSNPVATELERKKYIRFAIDNGTFKKLRLEIEKVWGARSVSELVEQIESESKKPNPKRYYVSLKEPLEGDIL